MLPTAFTAHLETLAAQALVAGSAAAMPGVVRSTWQVPTTFPSGYDIQDPAGFVIACDRSGLNSACVAEYEAGTTPNAGRLGVVGALKTAIDYQAAYERALHARHASAVRCRVWASARRAGHSDMTYGVFGCVSRGLEAVIGAARTVPNAQEET